MSARKPLAQALVIVIATSLISLSLVGEAQKQPSQPLDPNTVYTNATAITINSTTSSTVPLIANPYPSNIDVAGMTGTITRVAVTLNGFSHTAANNVDILLVSPTGAKYIFMADIVGNVTVEDRLLTFADDAAATVPFGLDPASGAYRPTSGDGVADTFPAPAPVGPYNQPAAATFASTFNGANPNGTWSLYVVDDNANEAGSIHSGWSITVTTDGAPTTFTNTGYIGILDTIAASTPYGTVINVTGATGVISNLKVSLTGFSHTRPQDVDVLLVSPDGRGVVVMSDVGGSTAATGANLTFDDAAAGPISGAVVSGTFRPSDTTTTGTDVFPSPAPLRPYHSFTGTNQLSNFYGYNPNGEWRLFVIDAFAIQSGSISGGWSLDITTGPATPPPTPSCGAPSFTASGNAAGISPTGLVIADFNNDMKHDVATANQVSNDVSVLLGNGNGTFMPHVEYAVGSSPYSLAAGKLNADNNVDLAVVNSASNTVSILLGNGDGTFGTHTTFPTGPAPIAIAVGDLNGDMKADLAIANFGNFFSGSVSILLGNGMGGFTPGTAVRTRTQPSAVALATLNPGDSFLDLVVTSFGSDTVTTFLGTGSGTFQLSQNLGTIGVGPVSVDVAEFGIPDGFADLVVANYNNDSISVCNGTSGGTFNACQTQAAGGSNPISVALADFTGTNVKTPAIALSGSSQVRVGTSQVSTGLNPNAVESVDLNGDGKPDLVSANSGSNDITVMLNNCAVARGNFFDWDGDRRTDFAVMRPSTQAWWNASLSLFGAVKNFSRPGDKLVPADYDGDSRTDYGLYRPESGLWVVHTGINPARTIYFLQFGLADDIPVPADYDGDGKADLAVFRPSNGTWYVRRTSDHALQITQFGASGDKPVQADFDGDRKDDLAVFRPSTGVWYVLRSSDSGAFIVQFGASEDKTVAADYDGDQKADVAVWRPSTGVWWILRSSDGGFSAVAWGNSTDIPVVGDFENDGKYDRAVFRPSDRTWYVYKSSDQGAIYFAWGLNSDVPIPNSYVR